MIALMTGWMPRCANITAPSISSSESSLASDSTIITASCVPATTRSSRPSATWALVGLRMYSPSLKLTRAEAIGPMNGTPEMVQRSGSGDHGDHIGFVFAVIAQHLGK